jgi:hypothetical protein
VTTTEDKMRTGKKKRGKPKQHTKRSRNKTRQAARRDAAKAVVKKECKDKQPIIEPGRSGGIYISMDGSKVKNRPQLILELREMLNHEDNELKEKSLKKLIRDHPKIQGWIHDLVCRGKFADDLVKWKMLDAFHVQNHIQLACRRQYNPRTKKIKTLLTKMKVTNTQICEQTWSFFNRHYFVKFMSRVNYRAWLRHLCKEFNRQAYRNKRIVRNHLSKHGKRGRE